LENGQALRFKEIYDGLEGESAATLTRRLRELSVLGLIKRDVKNEPESSILVTYRITDEGREALQHIDMLENIVKRKRAAASRE